MAAMDLHRDFAGPEIISYLLIEHARNHEAHDFAFARRQRLVAFSQLGKVSLLSTRQTVTIQSLVDRIQQVLVLERLSQKLHGTGFHGLHRHRDISVTGDEDDGDLDARVSQLALKVQAVDARKAHIHNEDRGGVCGVHSCASTLLGRAKRKLAPRGELLAAHKRPPCDSTIERLMESPIPVPCDLVVKNAWKIWSACCIGRPTPVSLTVTRTCAFSPRCDLIASSRGPSTFFIASMPLSMRFISTCCNCTRSPMTWGRSAASSVRTAMLYRIASLRRMTIISRITSFTSTNSRSGVPFLKSSRTRLMISAPRLPSFTILITAARASSTFGGLAASQRKQVLALVTAAAIG